MPDPVAPTDLSGDKPPPAANAFVEAVTNARKRASQSSVAGLAGNGDTASSSGNRKHGNVLKFIGFLAAESPYCPRRLYFTEAMKSGVDVENDAIIYHRQLPVSDKDGLQRDAIWVLEKDDVIYWSKEPPPKTHDPKGGSGSIVPFGAPI